MTKEDNEILITSLIDIAINSDGSHYDIAKVVQAIYKNECNDFYKLRNDLSENIHKKFSERACYFNNLCYNENDEGKKEIYNKKALNANKICIKLKNSGFKGSIIKECKYLFMNN